MAEGSDISIDIVLKEQVKPALDALSAGIAEFTKTLSILTAQAKSAGDAVGKTGEKAEKVSAAAATAKKETSELAAALEKDAAKAKDAAAAMDRFGTVVERDSPRIRSNAREVEALVSSYARFRQAVANAVTTVENKVRGLRSAKEALKDFRENMNGAANSLLSFKNLAIAAVAVLGAFKAKQFLEGVVKDAAALDETLRKAAAAVGQLDNATTERLREDLKRLSIQEGASVRELAAAAVGVIPDVGEQGLAEFLRVSQRFSEVAGGNVGQIADTLIFTLKGFGIEAKDASESLADLASAISDKLFVAAREGNIAIGQLTGIIGLAAQQAEVLGISFDELLAAFTALGDVGVKPVRAFRVLSGVLNGVQEPSFKVKESIDRVNQTIPNLNLNFSRAGLAADGLGKFLSKLTIALKADDDLAKELGLNTRELGLIFKATANDGQAFAEALSQITNSRGEVDRAAEFILEGTEGKLRRIQSVFAALKDDIAQIFIPALDNFLKDFLQAVSSFRDAFGGSLSEIRQAAALVAQNPNLDDSQKRAALQSLSELQRQVNKAGLTVLAEAVFTAIKTGGDLLGKLLLAAFARGGLILKDTIVGGIALAFPSLVSKPPEVELRELRLAQTNVQRLSRQAGVQLESVPSALPVKNDALSLQADVTRLISDLRSLFDLERQRVEAGAPALAGQSRFLSAEGLQVVSSEIAKQFASFLREGETLTQLAVSGDPADAARFNDALLTVLSRNGELLQQLVRIRGFDGLFQDTGAQDARILQSIFDSLKRVRDNAATVVPQTFQANTGDSRQVNENAPESTRRVVVDAFRRATTGELPSETAAAITTIIKTANIANLSVEELASKISALEATVLEREAVFQLTIGEWEQSAFDAFTTATRAIGRLGEAQRQTDPTKRSEALSDVQGMVAGTNLSPLIQSLIELEDTGDRVNAKIAEIGETFGFVIERNAEGVLQVREAAQSVTSALTSTSAAASESLSTLAETSQRVGTVTSRLNESVSAELETLAQRYANIEIARLRGAGQTQESDLADRIAASIAKIDELKKQIGKFEAADKALDDAALARVKELKEELRTQTEVVFSFVPDAKPLFDKIEAIKERISALRNEAALVTLGAGGAPGLTSLATEENAQRIGQALRDEQARLAQGYSDLIRAGTDALGGETQKAIREAIRKQGADAEKLVVGIAKSAARLNAEALRAIAKDEAGAKLIDQTVKDLDRLVSERQEAFGENLTDEVERLNQEIAGKIEELVDNIAGTAPGEIRDAYLSIVDTIQSSQRVTGAAAQSILDKSAANLNTLLQRLVVVSQGLATDLARNELALLRAQQAFETRRREVGTTRAVAEPVAGRLDLGGDEAKYQAAQIQALSSALQRLEEQLERIRNAPLSIGEEEARQREIAAINTLIDRYNSLLQQKLQEQGVTLQAGDTAIQRLTLTAQATQRLIDLEIQRVPVLESIRQIEKEANDAAKTFSNTQKLAAQTTKTAYAEVEAVYGRAIFQIDGSASAQQRNVQATKAYIAVLDGLLKKLVELSQTNPELAGDIQPQIDNIKDKIVDLKTTLPAEGNVIGTSFVEGLKQGLGAADSLQEFAANLGRGIGGAIQGNLGAAIDSVIDGTKSLGEAFRDFVSDTLIDIGKLIIKMLVLQAIQSALGFPLFGLNQGGEVPSPVELNRGGMVPHPYQPTKWSGYNDGGVVADEKPNPRGIMGRIRQAVARIKPPKPEPAPMPIFVRAFAQGGAVTADPLVRAINTIVNVLTPQPQQMRFYDTGGFVARDVDKTPRIDRVINTISRVFDPDSVQRLNTGGEVQESGVGKAIKALADILNPPEPQVLALAGGGIAYLEVGGFPSNAPRRQGRVPGPNVNKDVVPAMLTPGEFVMKRSAVERYGLGVMYAMNEGIVPRDMFGSLKGVRKLATGGTAAEADIPARIEVNVPQQGAPAAPMASGGTGQPVPAYIVANEQAMQNLLNGGKNAMLDFMRRNKT